MLEKGSSSRSVVTRPWSPSSPLGRRFARPSTSRHGSRRRHLPRGVGIGLDSGEAIPLGDGYRGTALNLAARLCAQAGPGEILASEAVIHLAAKVDGISYVDARSLKLKGYDESIRAVAVVPTDRAKGRRPASGRGSQSHGRRWLGLGAAARRRRRRRRRARSPAGSARTRPAGSASPSALAIGSAQPRGRAEHEPGRHVRARRSAVARVLRREDGHVDGRRSRCVRPRGSRFSADGSFWQVQQDPPSVDRDRPETREGRAHVHHPASPSELGFAFSKEALWFTDLRGPTVVRLDEGHQMARRPFQIGEDADDRAQAGDIVVGGGSVWFSRPGAPRDRPDGSDDRGILRADRGCRRVHDRLRQRRRLVHGDGRGRPDRPAYEHRRPSDQRGPGHASSRTSRSPGGSSGSRSRARGSSTSSTGRRSSTRSPSRPASTMPSATSDTVWVANNRDGTMTGIDVVTGQTRTIDTGHATLSVATSDHRIMVAVGPTSNDVLGQIEGDVLTLAVDYDPVVDPVAGPTEQLGLDGATVRVPDVSAARQLPGRPRPRRIRAETGGRGVDAEREPGWSDVHSSPSGPGLQFSPPSGEPITAETYRASIERACHPSSRRMRQERSSSTTSSVRRASETARSGRSKASRPATTR